MLVDLRAAQLAKRIALKNRVKQSGLLQDAMAGAAQQNAAEAGDGDGDGDDSEDEDYVAKLDEAFEDEDAAADMDEDGGDGDPETQVFSDEGDRERESGGGAADGEDAEQQKEDHELTDTERKVLEAKKQKEEEWARLAAEQAAAQKAEQRRQGVHLRQTLSSAQLR